MLRIVVLLTLASVIFTQYPSSVDPNSIQLQKDSCDPILKLEPEQIWKFFCQVTKTPRVSGDLNHIGELIYRNMLTFDYPALVDTIGNILVTIPPSKGRELRNTIWLQTHMDMVGEKDSGHNFNFKRDYIQLLREGDYIKANKTNLGAESGLAMALMIALVSDKSLQHGPIKLLFTRDAEIGQQGYMRKEKIQDESHHLINLNGNMDGIAIGSAGGQFTVGKWRKPMSDATMKSLNNFVIGITGLEGGHSGLDIDKKRGNAIKLLSQLLKKLYFEHNIWYDIYIINGGKSETAIPREAKAVIQLRDIKQLDLVKSIIADFKNNNVTTVNPNANVIFHRSSFDIKKVIDQDTARSIIDLLVDLPDGVISTNDDGVETSTNLASITSYDYKGDIHVTITTSQRSSNDAKRKSLGDKIISEMKDAKADETSILGEYPAWHTERNTVLLNAAKKVYKKIMKKDAKTQVLHNSIENSVSQHKFMKWTPEMISVGVKVYNGNSPNEKFHINDVMPTYRFLYALIHYLSEEDNETKRDSYLETIK
jgi:dipeptidase D